MTERNKSKKEIEIENAIKPLLDTEGFCLVECCYVTGIDPQVRIFVYNKEDTSVEKLGLLNKKIFPLIASLPSVGDDFSLEVSSPGLFRKFKYNEEFEIFKNRNIRLTTSEGETYAGTIEGVSSGEVTVIDKKNIKNIFKIDNIISASLDG
jgi:ribosome maturation factor RimP